MPTKNKSDDYIDLKQRIRMLGQVNWEYIWANLPKTERNIDQLWGLVHIAVGLPPNAGLKIQTLHKDEYFILKILNEENHTMLQVDMEAAAHEKGRPLTRKTIGVHLFRLESLGLVERPFGERKGFTITEKGRERLKK
ncbi:MAG: hypothetical protein NT039_04865 [Candidatus Berkelbacteria bacterium]|nr:hypothetical protein [Candidatus Berkelbacteria bacterium]